MSEFKKCCCYQCPMLIDANSSPDCACEDAPAYSQSQCMDCPKRYFCDVTKQPQLYLELAQLSHNTGSPQLLNRLQAVLPMVKNGMNSVQMFSVRGAIADAIEQLRASA